MESTIVAIVMMILGLTTLIVSIPMTLIWTSHRRKMEEMKLKQMQAVDGSVQTQIEALRSELQALRDTSMSYDLSFETAMEKVEHRLALVERQNRPVYGENSPQSLTHGG